jgi:hypothetical protein
VVVDRRAVLEQEEARAREERLAELKEGMIVSGTVRSLTDFGAFVDIGGIDGLLHVTDMSWGRVNKPADLLKPADRIDVQILKIEQHGAGKRGRPTPGPWPPKNTSRATASAEPSAASPTSAPSSKSSLASRA